jgi:hypothetical protein
MKIVRFFSICLVLNLIIGSTSFAEDDPITFKGKTYGGTDYEEGNYVLETDDGGYLLLGTTRSFGNGNVDIYLVKTDKNGDEKWHKTYGGDDYEEGRSIQKTDDGGYLILGSTKSFGAGSADIYLIKIDGKGNEKWKKTFGGEGAEIGYSLERTKDGGHIIFGTYLIKLDKDGNEVWRNHGETGIVHGFSAHQTADGGYILLGGAKMTSFGRRKLHLSKTDADGKLEEGWPRSVIMISGGNASSVIPLSDGSYMVIGGTAALTPGRRDIYIEKTDPKGKKLWSKSFGGEKYDRGNSIQEISDNGFIILGNTQSSGAGEADVYLIKTSADGEVIWEKTFGGKNFDRGNFVRETSDGGFVIIGSTQSFGAGKSDMYLIKTDKDGNTE